MNKVLKDLSFVIAYLDDVIIFSKTIGDHLGYLKQIFTDSGMQTCLWNLVKVTSLLKKSNI